MVSSFLNRSELLLSFFLIGLFILAWQLQNYSILNWDVSFLYYASKKFLLGGTYTENFFETNTPFILLLYLPPVIAAKYLSLSEVITFNGYIFLLGILSLLLIYQLVYDIPHSKSKLLVSLFAFCFFILPFNHFGQREHLFLILIVPFIFLLRRKLLFYHTNKYIVVLCGFLGACGFLIKPFFILTFIFLEGYALSKDRSIFSKQKLELFVLLLLILIYVIMLITYFPDYLTTIIPILNFLYFAGFADNWKTLITDKWVFYCGIILFFYLVTSKKSNALYQVLFVSLISFLGIYFLERIDWYYHLIPAISFALILGSFQLVEFIHDHKDTYTILGIFKNAMMMLAFAMIVFYLPIILFYKQFEISILLNKQRQVFFKYVNKNVKKSSIYFISTSGINFPVFYYSNAIPISRFPSYWMLPGIINLTKLTSKQVDQEKLKQINEFFLTLVAHDIADHEPQWVFVDARAYNLQLKMSNFDVLNYLSQNNLFKTNWKNYRKVDSVYYYQVYRHI